MAGWRDAFTSFASNVEDYFDLLKYRFRERLGGRDPLMVLPYRGFGTRERFYLKGRVLEDEGITSPLDNDSIWNNMLNMYRRFESDEIPFARVRVSFQDFSYEVEANIEGYFEIWIETPRPLPGDVLWHPVDLQLISPRRPGRPSVQSTGRVLIPPDDVRYGVISDIDDTIIKTDTVHLLQMARSIFMGNARTRMPFPGIAALFRALHMGANGNEQNPIFYVSSGPWNIYDLITDFLEIQNIPFGPLFLRDWGLTEDELLPSHHYKYKMGHIRKILETYRDMRFILMGDSGQEDPEIYADVVEQYPDRVLAIYIRNVRPDPERPEEIHRLAERVAASGSTLILADDTLPLARHAAQENWISAQTLSAIEAEVKVDTAPPSPLEEILGEKPEKVEKPPITVNEGSPEKTHQAVEEGAVEEALQTGAEDGKPPTVIVEGEEEQEEDSAS